MDYKKMGSVIKRRRNALKITQEQLAEMINKSTVYISLIESGSRRPSLETLYSIAMSLKTSVDTIIYDKSSLKNDEHVDEFSYLLADRNEDEVNLVMNIVREILKYLTKSFNGKKRRGDKGNPDGSGDNPAYTDGFGDSV